LSFKKLNICLKSFFCLLAVMFLPFLSLAQTWVKKGDDIFGSVAGEFRGIRVCTNGDGSIIGTYSGSDDVSGDVKIFRWDESQWNQLGNTINSLKINPSGDLRMSANGNKILVTAYSDSVVVYELNSDKWSQQGDAIYFNGYSAADINEDGTVVAVGSFIGTSNNGIVGDGVLKLYTLEQGKWIQLGDSISGNDNDAFGSNVSLSSDGYTVAVGATYGNVNNSGYSRVYRWDGVEWRLIGSQINGVFKGERAAGVDLSADGNILAYSSFLKERIKVYSFNGIKWHQLGDSIEIKEQTVLNNFGLHLQLSNDGRTLVASAQQSSLSGEKSGSVYAYIWNGSFWEANGSPILGVLESDFLGSGIDISSDGKTMIVGAPKNDQYKKDAGLVQVFRRCNTYGYKLETFCDSATAGQGIFYSDTFLRDTILNSIGCDSIRFTNYVINQSVTTFDTITAYDSFYSLDGTLYFDDKDSIKSLFVSEKGCDSLVISKLIVLEKPIIHKLRYYIPNAFSPNGDNLNDYFIPEGEGIENCEMKVYNRWGGLVYTTTTSKGWDGDNASAGIYLYTLIIEGFTKGGVFIKESRSSTVTLIR
jgi:gliding motility-associated-like protein